MEEIGIDLKLEVSAPHQLLSDQLADTRTPRSRRS